MTLSVGSVVTRKDRPPSEHAVITEASQGSVTVAWHLKQATSLGPAGMSMGKVYDNPAVLVPDVACPHCKDFLVPVK